jgi:protein-tyrosine phosphatase
MASVLFVCLGNICRSPAGEAVLRHLAEKNSISDLHVRSCGMGDWHMGHLADERMREAAQSRGFSITSRSQQFRKEFLNEFDYILAADREVLNDLHRHAHTPEHKAKIHLITAYSSGYKGEEIPDPYYRSGGAFDLVMDMIEDSCEGLLEEIRKKTK